MKLLFFNTTLVCWNIHYYEYVNTSFDLDLPLLCRAKKIQVESKQYFSLQIRRHEVPFLWIQYYKYYALQKSKEDSNVFWLILIEIWLVDKRSSYLKMDDNSMQLLQSAVSRVLLLSRKLHSWGKENLILWYENRN